MGLESLTVSNGYPGYSALTKTVTFANTAADVNLFTVTGDVLIKLMAVCDTILASGAGCNLSTGVTGDLDALIAVTAATDIDANEIWHDATPDAGFEFLSVMKEAIIVNGLDITLDVETAKQVDSGVLSFYLWWAPVSADGLVVTA